MKRVFFLISLFTIYYSLFTISPSASAQTMSNSNYKIKMGNFNSASGVATGSANLNFELGEISPGLYKGTNYTVRAGFQYIKEDIPFAFSLTPTTIDFGTVSPNNPVTRISTLTVSNGSANGYTVTLSADRQPTSGEGYVIPGTSCDNGDCSEVKSGLWNSTLAYGFGFRCDPSAVSGQANDCSTDFASASFYKPLVLSPSSQTVLSGGIGKNKKAQVSYKVNVSPAQQASIYRNTITFIASPSF